MQHGLGQGKSLRAWALCISLCLGADRGAQVPRWPQQAQGSWGFLVEKRSWQWARLPKALCSAVAKERQLVLAEPQVSEP